VFNTLLITGGAGFIGSKLYAAVQDTFDKIVIVDNFCTDVHPNGACFDLLRTTDYLEVADLSNPAEINRVVDKHRPTAVVHLAAETATGKSMTEPSKHVSTNVLGSANLIEALASMPEKVRAVVLASTRAVYGEGSWTNSETGEVFQPSQRSVSALASRNWDFENSVPNAMSAATVPPNPSNVYGVTKNAQEQLLKTWCAANEVSFMALRLQNVYGPGQTIGNAYTGVLTHFADLGSKGEQIPLFEDGLVLRDFVYVSDVVEALKLTLNLSLSTVQNTVLDIGSGTGRTLVEVARLIVANNPKASIKVTGEYRLGDVRHAFSDISAAKEVLNWVPAVSLEKGIRELCLHVSSASKP
jgi:dTDP-L-rhamnose 4-epimerase